MEAYGVLVASSRMRWDHKKGGVYNLWSLGVLQIMGPLNGNDTGRDLNGPQIR